MFYALAQIFAIAQTGKLTTDPAGAFAFFLANPGDEITALLAKEYGIDEKKHAKLVTRDVNKAAEAREQFKAANAARDQAQLPEEMQTPEPPATELPDAILALNPTDDAHWTQNGDQPNLNVLKERLGRHVSRGDADAALESIGYEPNLLSRLGIKNPRGFVAQHQADNA